MPQSSQTVVAFHGYCRLCGDLAPSAVLERTGMLCEGCIKRGLSPKPAASVRLGSGARRAPTRSAAKSSKGSRQTRGAAKAAKMAALLRLRNAFPDLYRMLYHEERARRGLPPVPLQSEPLDQDAVDRSLRAAGERFAIDDIYDALAEAGIEAEP